MPVSSLGVCRKIYENHDFARNGVFLTKVECADAAAFSKTIRTRVIDAMIGRNVNNLLIYRRVCVFALAAPIRRIPSGNATAPFRQFGRK